MTNPNLYGCTERSQLVPSPSVLCIDPERSIAGNTIIRAGHVGALNTWTKTEHIVITPEQLPQLIADLSKHLSPDCGDRHGTPHPEYDETRARFRVCVTGHEPDEEDGWRYKLCFVDRKYQDGDGFPVDAVAAGNSWAEAFARAGEWIEQALATDRCIF